MISPAAAGPPSTTPRGPTWLDRLRSSRGFTPPPADAHLDDFLSSAPTASDPPTLLITPTHPVDAQNDDLLTDSKEEEDDDVADILCDLFAMGGGSGGGRKGETSNCSRNRRKRHRKQLNPKFWDGTGSSNKSSNAASGDHLRRRTNNNSNKEKEKDDVVAVNVGSSGDNSLNQQRRKGRDSKIRRELEEEEEEDEEVDLKGFSRSEVTVMDSSVEGWRVEMFVFRKRKGKSVWKAREKKSHESRALISCSRRKRKSAKANHSDDDDDDEEEEEESDGESDRDEELIRKMKKKKKVVRVSDSEDAAMPLINQGQVRGDKVDQTLKGVGCLRGEVSLKSFPCSNSHWKSKNGSSSVILVKPILKFDKIGTKKPEKISVNKGQSLA